MPSLPAKKRKSDCSESHENVLEDKLVQEVTEDEPTILIIWNYMQFTLGLEALGKEVLNAHVKVQYD